MHGELGALLALGLCGALWAWAIKGREIVDHISNRLCRDLAVQRLDQSVTLQRLRWGPAGNRTALCRIYGFEFSTTGGDRRSAEVCLLNTRPQWARLDHPDGAILINL